MITGKWSDKELKILKDLYSSNTRPQIAKILNRSLCSVVGACNTFNIKKTNKKSVNINIPDIILSYIAGIFDGEGCVRIAKMAPTKYGTVNIIYELQLNIVNTNKDIIEFLYKTIGCGHISKIDRSKENKKIIYRYSISNKKASQLLDLLLKYLIIKKKQAKIAINFVKTFTNFPYRKQTPKYLLNKREELYIKISKAKHE